ncbi:hypothetical protein N780_01905 [Pontibacillus chungwhensis BH030062]|uniref:DUF3221 domain-containing protein n=1 Tax=Pontibacillus chungwhensis BH030062 TaxID=1385513 RepID=A0A0A2UVV1_9BACI|nr:YobA family protein [Pontibacillus chungwhensis]KGP92397.1 hypothetical protein N780_01905 [Pontibacillus chungwhensis BH030062]
MRKGLCVMGFLFLMNLLIAGCTSSDESVNQNMGKPSYTGYVMDKDDSRILVVNPDAKDANNDGSKDYHEALWGSGDVEGVSIGERVNVWVEGSVMESYPGQGKIGKVEIISEEKPEGATLSKSEALIKALSKSGEDVKVVVAIEFLEEKNMWSVKLQDRDEVLEVSIEDP